MSWLIEKLKDFSEKTAIVFKGKSYTYQELNQQVQICTGLLKENNISPGMVVAVLSDYAFESIALLLALHENGNIIVPITTEIEEEIEDRLAESFTDTVVHIVDGQYQFSSREKSEKHLMISQLQDKQHSGLILFSSGSTGKPKAMIHDFDKLVNHYQNRKSKSMNMLIFLMFDHIGGLNTLLNILAMGATMIIPQNRNAADVCQLVETYKIKVLPSSPTFLNLILMSRAHEKYDLRSLRMITYGTEAMPDSLLNRLKTIFPKTKFLQTFGTSETGIANTASKSSNSTFMKLDDPNLEYKIVEGELWLKSQTQVMGYLNASMDSFTEDGWFKTGDLVEEIENGYIRIIGRNKEVINVGGEKVLPNEVESVLLSMDEIEDVMVFGQPNAITGQTVVCEAVLTEEMTSREIKKRIRKYCQDKLDAYKIPSKVNVVEKTSFGERFKKIRRK